jgi:hypothetical protein
MFDHVSRYAAFSNIPYTLSALANNNDGAQFQVK